MSLDAPPGPNAPPPASGAELSPVAGAEPSSPVDDASPPAPPPIPAFPAPSAAPPAFIPAPPPVPGGFVLGGLPPVGAPPVGAPPAEAPPAPRPPASITFLVVVTVLSLAADLVTKAWAKAHLSGYDPKAHGLRRLEVWKGYIEFIFAQNPGGAWSFLRGLPDSLRRPFFLVVSAGAIVFIVTIYQRVRNDQWAMKLGLPLALGGAAGNLVDRIRYGWVVDFIDFSLKWGGREHHWPTFNVADIAIVIGVGLMAIDMLRSRGLHYDAHHAAVSPEAG
jgi:signal peptidase II